jgi:hypothetical protein
MKTSPIPYYADSKGHHYWHYAVDKVLHVLFATIDGRDRAILNIIGEQELLYQLKSKPDMVVSNQATFDQAVTNVLAEMGIVQKL